MKIFPFLFMIAVTAISAAQEQSHHSVLFISDSQEPLWVETLRLREDHNEAAAQKLFVAMSKETTATALFHLGDITGMGMLPGYWRSFDTLRTLIPFPIYPVFGNHEYFFIASLGKEQTLKRFPFLEPSWYLKRTGNIAVVLLNSNFSQLSDDEITAQQTWYTNTLNALENDSTVRAIIVGCHHSPFTNSTIVESNPDVQRRFAAPFKQYSKTKLFISGHAHTYEHFISDGKDFLVIGGGGGLLHPLKDSTESQWTDLAPKKSEKKFFHYIYCELQENSIVIRVKMLNKDFSGITVADEIVIHE